jgi:isovaleryl-CoA dehydrogenase
MDREKEGVLADIIGDVVRPAAERIDGSAEFPAAALSALAANGLLGLTVPSEYGGGGGGLADAKDVVERLSEECGSTAMVVMMHYAATAALIATDRKEVLSEIAAGRHLSTLAFSEFGSRSHFWVPMSTALVDGETVTLDAKKSWVTSAAHADSYVWSSRPAEAPGEMSLWFVQSNLAGLSITGTFSGLGLRGNDSCPVTATSVRVPGDSIIGTDGQGLTLALQVVLPAFLVLNAAASVGLMAAVTRETASHLQETRLAHLNQSLAQQPLSRSMLARMRIELDRCRALVDQTLLLLTADPESAQLYLLEVKAAAGDAAALVADLALEACGGAAFRNELGIERRFRDSRAARVMAPTSSALRDMVGRALCGLPLFE